jgi:hypothetical protein
MAAGKLIGPRLFLLLDQLGGIWEFATAENAPQLRAASLKKGL